MYLRFFSFLLFLFVFQAFHAQAQNNSEAINITVSAQVESTIELFTIQTMDFRNVDRNNTVVTVHPILNSGAGKMVARGNPGTEFRITYQQSRELTNIEANSVLHFEYMVSGNHIDEQETSEMLDLEFRDLHFNDEGEFYIWVGGRTDLSNAAPGNYEGEFTIEIEYI